MSNGDNFSENKPSVVLYDSVSLVRREHNVNPALDNKQYVRIICSTPCLLTLVFSPARPSAHIPPSRPGLILRCSHTHCAREVFAPPPRPPSTAPCFHSSLNIEVIPGTGGTRRRPGGPRAIRSGKARVDVGDVEVVQWRTSFLLPPSRTGRDAAAARFRRGRSRVQRGEKKNSHIRMFSLKTSQTFEISFHPEMHHNVLLVLLRPSSERWLQGTPRPEDLRRGRRWVDSVEAQQCTGKSIPPESFGSCQS